MNVTKKLIERNITISTMESCTSGLLCSTLTNTEGASSVVIGGYITYCNEQKVRCGVPKEIIDTFGVYSLECAKFMALAAKKNSKSDIAIGVTGSLGNIDVNNKDSVVGDVYYGIASDDGIFVSKIKLPEDILFKGREEQKKYVVEIVLGKLENKILR